jgi:hypothetical protein
MAANKRAGKKSLASNDFLAPSSVTNLSVTDVGTNRAFDNGAFNVSWTLPAGSQPASSYDITTSPATSTTNTASTSATITGLKSATAYTVTVVAKNSSGSSSGTTSSSVTATTVPATPAAPTATTVANVAQDTVSWVAPANGGSAITGYIWASNDNKSNAVGSTPGGGATASTSVTVNQEAGTSQTYTVYAINANGNSITSAASTSVTTFSFTPFGVFGFSPFGVFGFSPFGVFGFSPFSVFSFSPGGFFR